MAVRNFWIEGKIDGRATILNGGPRRKDGGFSLTIYIRQRGGILRAVEVNGWVDRDGERLHLLTQADCSRIDGTETIKIETVR